MMLECVPDSFGLDTSPQLIQKLRTFLINAAEDEQFVMFNQDLVGFFPSIPAPRIMQACEWLITRYQQPHAVNTAIVFTASLAENQAQLRVFRGRACATGQHQVSIDLVDVLPLCHLSLQAGLFVHLGRVLKQVRGAAIGNQVSPVLANIAVSILEQSWAVAAKMILDEQRNTFFCVRYADNRLVLVSTRLLSHPLLREFLHLAFYKRPVELEDVESAEFLGFLLNFTRRELTALLPAENWQFKKFPSPGTLSQGLAGLRARISRIQQCVFPPECVCEDLRQLWRLYIQQGYPREMLQKEFARFTRKPCRASISLNTTGVPCH